jgi:hypothetical protein
VSSKFFKAPPFQIKLKPKLFKKKVENEAYEQMHQTLGLAVLTVLLDSVEHAPQAANEYSKATQ